MKVNVNIELCDNTTVEMLEQVGLTDKFLKVVYQDAFEQFVSEMCKDSNGVTYNVSVDVIDNMTE